MNKDSLQAIASGGSGSSGGSNGVKFSSSSSSASSSHREEGTTGYGSRGKPRSSTSGSQSQGQGQGQGQGQSSSFTDAALIDALLYPPGDDDLDDEGRDGVVSGYDNSGNDDVSSGGNEDDRCFVCNEGMGKLLLCDFPGCPRAYHQICVLTTFPVPLGEDEVGGGGGDDDPSSAVWFCPRHQCVCCDALQLNPEPEYEPEYMYQNSSSSDSAATATATTSSRGGGGRSGRANSGSSGSGDVRYVAIPPAKPPQPLSLCALQPLPYILPRTVGDSGGLGATNGSTDSVASSSGSRVQALSGFFVAGQGPAPGQGLGLEPGVALHRGQGLSRRTLRTCSGCPLALCGDCETGISEACGKPVLRSHRPNPLTNTKQVSLYPNPYLHRH